MLSMHRVLWALPACALPSQRTCVQGWAWSPTVVLQEPGEPGTHLQLCPCQLPHLLQVDKVFFPTLITKQYRGSVVVLYFLFGVFPCLPGDLQLSVACGDHADGGLEAGLVPSSSGCWTMAVSCCHSGASHRWAAVSSGHSMKDTVKWALLGPCPALGQKGVLLLGNR